ncbi:cupin domain-containing protein [Hymenobacter armeniacus]|uniref:Cupin domain-containing protein n=1 Tax=Hymenobacter armeniacus TaxID=2771358 RepID=A0ABR8JQ01_9BACT|nr:cupin domain-containing protein [Hymenobacter armeniacus]MBD2720655.1 cupin domain-containing protein [Hymenobacter armeniacus]
MKTTFLTPVLLAFLSACVADSDQPKSGEANGGIPPASPVRNAVLRTPPPHKQGFKSNIEQDTRANRDFRHVRYTGQHLQLVLMSLKPGEEIGSETHPNADQFFRFEEGTGKCVVNGHEYLVRDGDAVIAPAGTAHNVINTSPTKALKLYTIYAAPQHQDGVVRATKREAEQHETRFDGKTTE